MRNLTTIVLLSVFAANVNAACNQSDFVGRWEFLAGSISCKFYLDEEGSLYNGNCWSYKAASGAMGEPQMEGEDLGIVVGEFSVNGYCKVDAFLHPGTNFYAFQSNVGRLDMDKSIVSGLGAAYAKVNSSEVRVIVPYTMVKY